MDWNAPFPRYDDTSKKLNTCTENLNLVETKLSHSEKILEKAIRDRRKMEGDIDVLQKENAALKEAVETSKCSLEEEILLRVDIEHQLQSTKEEMNFKQQMFNKVESKSKYIGGGCVFVVCFSRILYTVKTEIYLWHQHTPLWLLKPICKPFSHFPRTHLKSCHSFWIKQQTKRS